MNRRQGICNRFDDKKQSVHVRGVLTQCPNVMCITTHSYDDDTDYYNFVADMGWSVALIMPVHKIKQ